MPSASYALRALMLKWFDDEVSDIGPIVFLYSHGFEERNGIFFPPTPTHNVSRDELACLRFLYQEWDYDFKGASPRPEDDQ